MIFMASIGHVLSNACSIEGMYARGSSIELHEYVCVLLHLQQLLIQRQSWYPPYGPWGHVLAHV